MHDRSGLRSTQVPLFWRHPKPRNMTGHTKCDRPCRRACAPLFGYTQATGGSVAGARSGATVSVLDQGDPSTCRLARSMKGKCKDSTSGGRTEALPASRQYMKCFAWFSIYWKLHQHHWLAIYAMKFKFIHTCIDFGVVCCIYGGSTNIIYFCSI
jgi:hypothetical protein